MATRRTPYITTSGEPITDPRSLPWGWVPDIAFTALRMVVAALVVWHGVQEHFGALLGPGQQWTGTLTPFTDPWIVATVKLAGGLLLAAGLYTRPAALVLAALALINHGVAMAGGLPGLGIAGELVVLQVAALVMFAFTGPGIVSVDTIRLRRRQRRRPGGMTVEMSPWVRRQYRRRDPAR